MTERILLIEDDPRLAEMVQRYLGEAGFDVVIAPKGELGIARHAREGFDCIILDLTLPGQDGPRQGHRVLELLGPALGQRAGHGEEERHGEEQQDDQRRPAAPQHEVAPDTPDQG